MQRQEVGQPAPQQLLGAGSDVTAAATQEGVRFVRAVRCKSGTEIGSKGQPCCVCFVVHHSYSRVAPVFPFQITCPSVDDK